jgi:hypothetical protein
MIWISSEFLVVRPGVSGGCCQRRLIPFENPTTRSRLTLGTRPPPSPFVYRRRRVARAYHQLQKQPTVILKHAFLASMRDQNQVLFYRLMQDHLKELLGILYTPGAAEAVMGYSYLFRRPLGCFIVSPEAGARMWRWHW